MYIPLFAGGIEYITNAVRDDVEPLTTFGWPIPTKVQVMATLRYLGSASLQLSVADTLGMSQSSVSRCVHRVCSSLYLKMDDYIQWPNDINSAKNTFFGVGGFPGVVGAIDGTHIRIQEPKNNENAFINRKYFPSINVYAVCDASQKFTFASIRWLGSCHDSFILRQTELWDQYEQNHRNGLILGDSGYPCRSWLLTPYIQPDTPAQQAFNRALARTRTVVECSSGRLKRRF